MDPTTILVPRNEEKNAITHLVRVLASFICIWFDGKSSDIHISVLLTNRSALVKLAESRVNNWSNLLNRTRELSLMRLQNDHKDRISAEYTVLMKPVL